MVKVAICAAITIALGGGILWYRNDSPAEAGARGNGDSADAITRITLDPQGFEGEARESYRIARAHPTCSPNFIATADAMCGSAIATCSIVIATPTPPFVAFAWAKPQTPIK
jgi:hypothetical protein